MTRKLLHIAIMLALCLGAANGARAMTPGSALAGTMHFRAAAVNGGRPVASLKPIYVQSNQYGRPKARQQRRMIPPSAALRAALRYAPGSQGLGVHLLHRPRVVYAVKVKSGNRIRRILVDAHTGRVLGE